MTELPPNLAELPIISLATNTSGLPSSIKGKHLTLNDILGTLKNWTRPPILKFLYSNLNFIILRYLLERIGNLSFNDQIQQLIFRPLGMSNNTTLNTGSPIQGYKYHNNKLFPVSYNYDSKYSVGSLNTTIADMQLYLNAHFDQTSPLYSLLNYCRKSFIKVGNRDLGLAWVTVNGRSVKDGSVPGFSSFIVIDGQNGIVIMANRRPLKIGKLAELFLDS